MESPNIHNQNQGKLQEKGFINQGNQFFQGNQYITVNQNSSGETEIKVDWRFACQDMLNNQLTSNSLFHDGEEAKKRREQIYVPLALVERKKSEKHEQDELSPEQGTKLYEPQYEEKQKFTHDTFLENILRQKQGKTQGQRIALIGEPGAGKTTLLQTIGNWILQQGLGLPVWVSLADLTLDGNLTSLEDYLLNSWLPFSPDKRQKVEDNFTEQFQQKRVWLLLDGVDEIATSGSQTLQNISRQLSGWVGKAQVVLTCRLNVWQADVNALSDFETFRLLDFDYPHQVHQFIDNWFDPPQPPLVRGEQEQEQDFVRGENSKGDRLKVELGKEEKARVRDLVQNPLRLALLCRSWQFYEGSLPETKAELYGQFVEQFYRWKSDRFPIKESKRRELNLALGRLAKEDIDSSGSRFRLRQDFIEKRLGDADDKNSLFDLALQIGWLNNVGVAAESPTKKVYAFLHATFEEYFAALAIDDWDFFLPRKHKKKPVKGRRYRIFEPQWKQVILLWLGREDVEEEEKEGFIKALTEFKDGCGNFLIQKKIYRGFYGYRAYFLAAAGIGEFRNYTKTDKIVEKIVDWGFNDRFPAIGVKFRNVLPETQRKKAIDSLVHLLGSTSDNWTRMQAAESLGKIDPGNQKAIDSLVHLLRSTADDDTLRRAAESLRKIGTANQKAIDSLVHLLGSTADDDIRWQVAENLWKIDPSNQKAIDGLVHLLESTSDPYTLRRAAESLWKIDPGNQKAINGLVHLLESNSDHDTLRRAAESLGKIDPGNQKAINGLVHLLESTSDHDTLRKAASSLEEVGTCNQNAIDSLVHLLESNSDHDTCRQAAESLGKIDPGNQKAIDSLVHLLESNSDLYAHRQAAESLGKIDPGNQKAIDALVHLVGSTSDHYTRLQAVVSLGKIGTGNQKAIDALVHLVGSTSNHYTRWQAVVSLGKIGTGNQKAIDALVHLVGSTADDDICWQAVASLEKIDPGNQKVIDGWVHLLRSISNSDLYAHRQAAKSLGKINPSNEKAIYSLVHLLRSTSDPETCRLAVESLDKILAEEQIVEVSISLLKNSLSVIGYLISKNCFNKSYQIIWNFAQTLSYPEFYQAWHPPFRLKKPRWLFW
ncbi:MAG: HEAT repeat domain-containing protein [Cyanobacteria bacterium P01_H01_bin.35]